MNRFQWTELRTHPDGRPQPPKAKRSVEGFGPAALAGTTLLILALAGSIVAGLRQSFPPAPAAAASGMREQREAELRVGLGDRPGDDDTRLQLSFTLLHAALAEAQAAYPRGGEWEPDGSAYMAYLAGRLPASPAFQEARQLAEAVAAHGRDPRARARGWSRLAHLHSLLSDPHAQLACMEEAVRENPAEAGSRETAANLRATTSALWSQ